MYKRKRAGNTITRKINSTKDTAAKADKNHYISNSYLEGFIPIDTEYFTASLEPEYHIVNSRIVEHSPLQHHPLLLSAQIFKENLNRILPKLLPDPGAEPFP